MWNFKRVNRSIQNMAQKLRCFAIFPQSSWFHYNCVTKVIKWVKVLYETHGMFFFYSVTGRAIFQPFSNCDVRKRAKGEFPIFYQLCYLKVPIPFKSEKNMYFSVNLVLQFRSRFKCCHFILTLFHCSISINKLNCSDWPCWKDQLEKLFSNSNNSFLVPIISSPTSLSKSESIWWTKTLLFIKRENSPTYSWRTWGLTVKSRHILRLHLNHELGHNVFLTQNTPHPNFHRSFSKFKDNIVLTKLLSPLVALQNWMVLPSSMMWVCVVSPSFWKWHQFGC